MGKERAYDIIVFGATGFTGTLVSQYLAAREASSLSWAIAGRSEAKLREVRQALPGEARPEIIIADVSDPESLRSMTGQGRVLLTTVGPYARYGEPVVAACVDTKTDYVDITGEPEFVDRVIARHHGAARDAGVRIVSCCGFDSIPPDLGTLFTVAQLPADAAKRVECFMYARGSYSGGTWHSAVNAFANRGAMKEAREARREALGDPPAGREVGSTRQRVHWRSEIKGWACPLPTIDPDVVKRSARNLEIYGPDFRYGHYAKVRKLSTVIGGGLGLGAIFALAQAGPSRRWLLRRKAPGQGPSAEERERGWFKVTFIGEGGGHRVRVEVSGGEPGYSETSKMVAESALCLAQDGDDLPDVSGVLTTAEAMGFCLITRLQAAGIRFEVVEASGGDEDQGHGR